MDAVGAQSTEAPALFTFKDTERYTRVKRSQAYGLMRQGKFPKPIKIGKSSRWVKAHIDSWIAEQVAAQAEV